LAKEQFFNPESRQVWKAIETAANRSHHSPSRAFDDFLTMTVCALSGGRMEAEYLEIAKRYSDGAKGRRAIDSFPAAFGALIDAMEKTRKDILGGIFEGAITHGENGQFFTPEPICQLMSQMTMDTDAKRVCDPCAGSGRNLLAAADVNPQAEFYGQDVDLRSV
jgi:type I restriction-modification system DNA methylase subunit